MSDKQLDEGAMDEMMERAAIFSNFLKSNDIAEMFQGRVSDYNANIR